MELEQVKPGTYVELTQDINCIPKGVYKIDYCDEFWVHFLVKNNIEFSLDISCLTLLNYLPPSKAKLKETSLNSFGKRYYYLLNLLSREEILPSPTLSLCCMNAGPEHYNM